jgi:hypothetical protein
MVTQTAVVLFFKCKNEKFLEVTLHFGSELSGKLNLKMFISVICATI